MFRRLFDKDEGPKDTAPGSAPTDYVELTVEEALSVDVGRGIARVDPIIAEQLGLQAGDAIEIIGKKRTFALISSSYSDDNGRNLMRIDGYTRENAGVSVHERVRIKKITAKYGETLKLAPIERLKIVGGEEYVKNQLIGRIVSKNDLVLIRIMSRPIKMTVTDFTPQTDVVMVNNYTQLTIEEKTMPSAKFGKEEIGMSDEDRPFGFFQAIGSPVRLSILELLRSGGLGYNILMEGCNLNPETKAGEFSFHIKGLMRSGLVELDTSSKEYRLTSKGECVSWHIAQMKRGCLTSSDE